MTLSAAQIKFIRSLSMKKFREESGLFIVEGEKGVKEALNSEFKVREVFRTEEIGEKTMERISQLSSPSPVLALVEKPAESRFSEKNFLLSYLKSNKYPLFLALDNLKDPGNLGTIIRIADWFGIDAIFASEQSVELYNPKTVQATMGAIFRVPVIYSPLAEIIESFKESGMPVYATTLQGNNIYREEKMERRGLIIIGSESSGISESIAAMATNELLIPSYPEHSMRSESLNAAIATAIICAEFRRPL